VEFEQHGSRVTVKPDLAAHDTFDAIVDLPAHNAFVNPPSHAGSMGHSAVNDKISMVKSDRNGLQVPNGYRLGIATGSDSDDAMPYGTGIVAPPAQRQCAAARDRIRIPSEVLDNVFTRCILYVPSRCSIGSRNSKGPCYENDEAEITAH
jgi:hypothetical protein